MVLLAVPKYLKLLLSRYQADPLDESQLVFKIKAEGKYLLSPQPRITTELRYHRKFKSSHLQNSRTLIVYLPPSYRKQEQNRYSVLYMHDGNNLFDPATAFCGVDWRADEIAQRLIQRGEIEEIIIVGIYNTPTRIAEYTWTPMRVGGKVLGGQGLNYSEFLTRVVKPFIDRTYRTLPDRPNTAVMGSSLGGLISFYLGRYCSDTFGKVGAMSPSLWWDNRAALKAVPSYPRDLQLWLDMGTHEYPRDPLNSTLRNARELHRALKGLGYSEGSNFMYYEDKGGGHSELFWSRRLELPLRFFFGKVKPGDNHAPSR